MGSTSKSDAFLDAELAKQLPAHTAIPGYWSNLEKLCDQWACEVTVSPLWRKAKESLDQWRTEYKSQTGGDLLPRPGLADFSGKGEKRIRSKLVQLIGSDSTVVEKIYPSDDRAPIPRLNDLVRTRVSCRFIDGVEFLADKLVELGEELGVHIVRERAGRVEGYFAQHLSFSHNIFYKFGGSNIPGTVICEVQVATELATVMWETSHAIYEQVREEESRPEDWQWNPSDPQFVKNQLGHMMHLADGLLVQLRDMGGNRRLKEAEAIIKACEVLKQSIEEDRSTDKVRLFRFMQKDGL